MLFPFLKLHKVSIRKQFSKPLSLFPFSPYPSDTSRWNPHYLYN